MKYTGRYPEPGSDEVEKERLEKGGIDHEVISKQLENIRTKEAAGKRSERTVLWFAVIATLISIVGVTFLPQFSLQLAVSKILGVVSLIWLLAAAFFLYKSETVAQPTLRLAYTRLIVLFAMVSVIISIYAVTFFLEPDEILSSTLEFVALFWLIGASFFLYRALYQVHIAKLSRTALDIGPGDIEYVDTDKHRPEVLVSEKFKLRGRPDYILSKKKEDSDELEHIPVEVKTGRTPQGPLFSHILQIATYCMLLEDTYKKTPSHGILKYGKIEHEIEFNDELKGLVLSKIKEMRGALVSGDVHRNHNRPGKCRSCSRRGVCSERLT